MLLNCGVGEDSFRVPWTARRSNQSILKEISPEYSLEGLMLKLKLQYFGHQLWRIDSLKRPWCWEGLKAGGEGDDRGWDGWMASPTRWTWVWVNSGSWWWTGRPGMLGSQNSWGHKELDTTERLNWIELKGQNHKIYLHNEINLFLVVSLSLGPSSPLGPDFEIREELECK